MTQRLGDEPGLSPGLTEEETARLLALFTEAYPSPRKDIRAAVMERIRAEREAQDRAKILPAADSRRTRTAARGIRMGRAAKWGALAACLVLVTAVGVRFLPALTKNLTAADHAVMNEAAAYDADMGMDEAAEAMPEMPLAEVQMKSAQSGSGPRDDVYDDADESPAEVPAAMEMPAPTAVPTEEPAAPADRYELFTASNASNAAAEQEEPEAACEAEEEYFVSEEAAYAYDEAAPAAPESAWTGDMLGTSLTVEAPAAPFHEAVGDLITMENTSGGFKSAGPAYVIRTDCAHAGAWRNSYHDIPAVLIERVGAEEFGAWAAEAEAADPCGVNILSFALRFGLTKEDIYAVGDVWYYLDLPEDLALTEENAAAIEAYYLAGGDPEKMAARGAEYEYKTAIVREAGLENYLAWRAGKDNSLRAWTVREAADYFGISEERLEELAEEAGYCG
ncbi:MAG: hypothetical protein II889_05835 [Clostridia bacterium]|nr:hypothetical protein [Clostridia bacterium]